MFFKSLESVQLGATSRQAKGLNRTAQQKISVMSGVLLYTISLTFLTLLFFHAKTVDGWRIRSLEEDEYAPEFHVHTCPYYDQTRTRCFYVVGSVFDRDACDCKHSGIGFSGSLTKSASSYEHCRDQCNGDSECSYFTQITRARNIGDDVEISCDRLGSGCDQFRNMKKETSEDGYAQVAYVTWNVKAPPEIPRSKEPPPFEFQMLRDQCAPACPELDTAFTGQGCNPIGPESYGGENTTNTAIPVHSFHDCVELCRGRPGWRVAQVDCQYWTYYAESYSGPNDDVLPGTCQLFYGPLVCRRPGRMGAISGTRFTGGRECSASCVMSEWTTWSDCSQTCGMQGLRRRTRQRIHSPSVDAWYDTYQVHNTPREEDKICDQEEEDTQECGRINCPVDCEWGAWDPQEITDDWKNHPKICDTQCGGGYAYRSRSIITHGAHGGKYCNYDESVEEVRCNEQLCPGCHVTDWSDWSSCSVTCETGHTLRTRSILEGTEWAEGCDALIKLEEDIICTAGGTSPIICPKDCLLGEWTDWSPCTRECDAGVMIMTRHIEQWNQGSSEKQCGIILYDDDGKVTDDLTFERVSACNIHYCPRDCEVTEWTEWSECVAPPCGQGVTYRTRTVAQQSVGSGTDCPALVEEIPCDAPPLEGETCASEDERCWVSHSMIQGAALAEGAVATMVEECLQICHEVTLAGNSTCRGFNFNTRLRTCELYGLIDTVLTEGEGVEFSSSGAEACFSSLPTSPDIPDIEPPKDVLDQSGRTTSSSGGGGVPVGVIVGASVGSLALLAAAGGVGYAMSRGGATDDEEDIEAAELAGGDRMLIGTQDYAGAASVDYADDMADGEDETNVATEDLDSDEE